MAAKFMMGRASLHSTYVPSAGEVCRHEQPAGLPDRVVIGDGKTAAPDLPSLQPLDFYARVERLEEDVRMLREQGQSDRPQPNGCTLTDEEREAVEQAIDTANGMAQIESWALCTLRNLLERLK